MNKTEHLIEMHQKHVDEIPSERPMVVLRCETVLPILKNLDLNHKIEDDVNVLIKAVTDGQKKDTIEIQENCFMNERIRELAVRAENYAHEQNDKFGLSYKREYDKKFAELIISECLASCKDAQNAFLLHGMQEREAHGAISVQEYIKEQFGMK